MSSIINYVADGSTSTFQIPFNFIDRAHVVVTVDGTTVTPTFINDAQLSISPTPTSGLKVTVKRSTPVGALVDFTDGSTLFEADLDLAHKQNRFIAEESSDRADSAIDTVNVNITSINTVAADTAAINAVSGNITNVNSVATNMAEVLLADTNAATATNEAAASAASAAAALVSETNAGTSETNSASSATSAAAQVTLATTAKTAAELAETNAETAETNAATSATNAATSATNAATSATTASTGASTASTKATEAATSATSASTSATAASSSETAAATSESNASTSETNAATSATSAATSATASATSATAAAASEAGVDADRVAAQAAASTATTKASEASTSETNAATSASTATTKASEAATSATNSATSATESETAKTAAEAAKDAALAALDSFDDRYLGAKASDPTLDNDGNALVAGALYYNTTDDVMKVYEGTVWVAAYASLSGALLTTNNLSDVVNVSSSRTNLGLGTTDSPTFAGLTTTADGLTVDGGSGTGSLDFKSSGAARTSIAYNNSTALTALDAAYGPFDIKTGTGGTSVKRLRINSNGDISFYEDTGTTPKLFWDASTERLGIGTAAPATALDVTGAVTAGDINITGPSPTLKLTDNDVADEWTRIQNASGSTYIDSRNGSANGSMIFRGSGGGVNTEYARFGSSGNFGIGDTFPTEALSVTGNIAATGTVTAGDVDITGSTPNLRLFDTDLTDSYTTLSSVSGTTYLSARAAAANAPIILGGNGGGVFDEYARFNSNGKFGINTTSPEDLLDISRLGGNWTGPTTVTTSVALFHSGTTNAGSGAAITIGGGNTSPSEIYFADLDDTDVGKIKYDHADNSMAFNTNNSERMVIDSAGNLTATGTVTATDLNLNDTSPRILLTDTDGTNQWTSISEGGGNTFYISRNDATKGQHIFQQVAGGVYTEAMRINTSGNVQMTGSVTAAGADFTGAITSTGTVVSQDEVRAEVIAYGVNQDAPYMVAATTSYTGATTNWGTYGYQHRLKSTASGGSRITVDTLNGEVYSLDKDGDAVFAGSVTSNTGLLAGAGAAAGAVGTYAFLTRNTAYVVFGSTYGGGGLRPAGLSSTAMIATTNAFYHDDESADLYVGPGTATATTPGTWRCMGQVTTVTGMDRGVTLFLRIA